MEHLVLLEKLIMVLAIAIGVAFLCNFIHIPLIVGLLLTGIVAGPQGFGLIASHGDVETLSEIGVIFLLLAIGIEFSLTDLWKIKRSVLWGGALQLALNIGVFALIISALGQPLRTALFLGCLIAPSSTAIVLKLLQERAEIESPQGRNSLAILIFQDIAIVPIMLLLPFLAGKSQNIADSLVILSLKTLAIVGGTIAGAVWIVPRVLYYIAKTRNREIFLLTIVVIAFAVALVTSRMGLSVGLGAFLAGLIISESRFSHQALSGILPFCHLFISFFFISIGMLLDLGFVKDHLLMVSTCILAVLIGKVGLTGLAVLLLGLPLRIAIMVGIITAQIGEFSFIMAIAGLENGIELGEFYQLFLTVAVVSMAYTPFLIALAPKIADVLVRFPFPRKWVNGLRPLTRWNALEIKDHLFIVGFGLNGRNLAAAARMEKIPYVILEMNPVTVREEAGKGQPIHYGDATQEPILEHCGIREARLMVIVISDPFAVRKIATLARKANPNLYIIARTRFVSEMQHLYDCGANDVIPEEFETSVEIFTRVLRKFLIPEDKIEDFTRRIRANSYQMFRKPSRDPNGWTDLSLTLPEVEIRTFSLRAHTLSSGNTLATLDWKRKHGITVLVIRRDGHNLTELHGDTRLYEGDVVIAMGKPQNISAFNRIL